MVNMTELGLYPWIGRADHPCCRRRVRRRHVVIACPVIASGAALLPQLGAFGTVSAGPRWMVLLNGVAMIVALSAWAVGAFLLL